MSKKKVSITFTTITQLWNFAKTIQLTNFEIRADLILICDCTDADIVLLSQYGGKIIEENKPVSKPISDYKT